MLRLIAVVSLLALAACTPPFVERTTQVAFDPAGDFWAVPLPSALRTQDDGTSNVERWPGARPNLVKMWLSAIDARVKDGWGINAGAFFTLTGGALDPASLPSASETLTVDAAIQFIDIDPNSPEFGRRFPVDATFTADAITYRPASLLAVNPVQGFPRRPGTLYAVLLLDSLKDTSGQSLGRSPAFHEAFEQTEKADPKAKEALAPLRRFVDLKRLAKQRIIGGTVFRTIEADSILRRLAAWVETYDAPVLEQPWTQLDDAPDYTLYAARYRVPFIQSGAKPGKGHVVWAADGVTPVVQGTQSVRLSVAMPKRAAPPTGVPLTLYFHGSGGEYRELMDRGPLPPTAPRNMQGEPPLLSGPSGYLARRGIATMGFDFPLHGDRDDPPDTSGLKLYDLFGDIDSTVDNMNVAAMEATYLTRLLTTVELPVPGGGTTRVDLSRLSAMGHSMGSTIGIPVATIDPRIKGYVFSGAGGLLLEVATETTYPVELHSTLELLLGFQTGERLDRNHPLLHAFQSLWDFTDPVGRAPHVAREPYPGQVAKPFFLPQGLVDGYFHPGAQAAVGGALGTTLLGDELDPTLPRTLRLDGRGTSQAFPLRNNLNGVTAGTVQLQTPFSLGHYVMFDVPSVGAQVGCFLAGVGSAEGPAIVSARRLDDGCD
ncbi:MAG: hypothetical protein U0228_10830 [Myxococcaceae bacterium]